MKYIKTFESFQLNEITGLEIFALGGLALASGAIYNKARELWSKHFIGSKYEETGNAEEIGSETIKEYVNKDGELFYGYDHPYNPNGSESGEDYIAGMDMYTAMFAQSDLEQLKVFLSELNAKREEMGLEQGKKHMISNTSQRLESTRPTPIDMIYRRDLDSSGYSY